MQLAALCKLVKGRRELRWESARKKGKSYSRVTGKKNGGKGSTNVSQAWATDGYEKEGSTEEIISASMTGGIGRKL